MLPARSWSNSSTRKAPSVQEKVAHDEFDEKPFINTVQVKRRKIIIRPKSTPFFRSEREFLYTSSMSLYDLT